MNKEALKCLKFLKEESINDISCFKDSVTTKTLYQLYFTNFDIIEQALTQEEISDANISEALECLEEIGFAPLNECCGAPYTRIKDEYDEDFNTIKQALVSAQKIEDENNRYKQLEKDLGCPLEVVFKALKDGIYVNYGHSFNPIAFEYHEVIKFAKPILKFEYNNFHLVNEYEDDDEPTTTKNYKKTWWLRKDKSE